MMIITMPQPAKRDREVARMLTQVVTELRLLRQSLVLTEIAADIGDEEVT